MRLASLLLTAVLGACTSPSTHSALGPDRERVSSSKLPPELHRCLDFQHQLDAIERRFLPPGARDGDPVAAFVAFVESELRLPVRIEDGCTLDPKGCSVALEEVAVGPCSLRHVLNRGNAARGARTAWFADGEQLHLVHARDVDAWIAQLPADSDFLSVRERLLVQWEPARLEGDDAGRLTRDYRSLETGPRVVLRGRLAWRDEQGALRPLEVSTTLLLTLGCRPGVEAWCPDWVTENWTPATGTDLSQCGDSAGDHSFTREL
ncbi:MAG: hypothetical protein HZA53_08440, partial [Planctomycetes bacterium]|nr:hypothetical protein [Planctomycetota bacterium]